MTPNCLTSTAHPYRERECYHLHEHPVFNLLRQTYETCKCIICQSSPDRKRIEGSLKTKKLKIYQTLLKQSSSGTKGSTKKSFPVEGMKKMRRSSYKLCPNSSVSTVIYLPTPIYQLTAPPPPSPAYKTLYHLLRSTTSSINTHQTAPKPIIIRIAHKEIPLETQIKLPEIFPLWLNHYLSCTKSFGTPNSLLESSQNQ